MSDYSPSPYATFHIPSSLTAAETFFAAANQAMEMEGWWPWRKVMEGSLRILAAAAYFGDGEGTIYHNFSHPSRIPPAIYLTTALLAGSGVPGSLIPIGTTGGAMCAMCGRASGKLFYPMTSLPGRAGFIPICEECDKWMAQSWRGWAEAALEGVAGKERYLVRLQAVPPKFSWVWAHSKT